MRDDECIALLRWCLPHLGLRWAGYRKVRGTVCKRIDRRLRELQLPDADAYRLHLRKHPEEWACLDAMCRIPISRFYRDRQVFDLLRQDVLPSAACSSARTGSGKVRCWSVGCASGEEVYTLCLIWRLEVASRFPEATLSVLGTDAEETMVTRARRACYGPSSFRELPPEWIARGFDRHEGKHRVKPEIRVFTRFEIQDVRRSCPPGPFPELSLEPSGRAIYKRGRT